MESLLLLVNIKNNLKLQEEVTKSEIMATLAWMWNFLDGKMEIRQAGFLEQDIFSLELQKLLKWK